MDLCMPIPLSCIVDFKSNALIISISYDKLFLFSAQRQMQVLHNVLSRHLQEKNLNLQSLIQVHPMQDLQVCPLKQLLLWTTHHLLLLTVVYLPYQILHEGMCICFASIYCLIHYIIRSFLI